MAILFSTVFSFLLMDAVMHDHAFFDVAVAQQVQKVDLPYMSDVIENVSLLTSAEGAIITWVVTLAVFVALRWWAAAIVTFIIPAGGIVNEAFGMLADRGRPTAEHLTRISGDAADAGFPSGHVMGAVLLYGVIFVVARRIANPFLRLPIQVASASIIAIVGFGRVWEGAHWPTDVAGAYALGATVLVGLVALYCKMNRSIDGLPLVKAAEVPHDEDARHAHALTSVVVFNGATVSKIYAPGFIPRAIYWLAFQAEFPYIRNKAALEAAKNRRNLAAMLTQYWYGERRVARVLSIDEVDDQYAVTSEFVDASEAEDKEEAKAFLRDLRERFEGTGLPTWQIDPRQPRAVDNVLKGKDGKYWIVDLESGLVAPVASVKSWVRGIRRGLTPLYDDVYYDITRRYVWEREREMREALGSENYNELFRIMEAGEAAQREWREREPRIWGRLAGGVKTAWGVKSWPRKLEAFSQKHQAKAAAWLTKAVDRWEAEERITDAEAARLRDQIASPAVQATLPHMGAHIGITVFLRFPLGSIARATWTFTALAVATARLFARRISMEQWKREFGIHSPLVLALSVIPGFGAFAYVAAAPIRQNRLLIRAASDMALQKVPGGLYEKSPLRRVWARPVGYASTRQPVSLPSWRETEEFQGLRAA
jgi:undecaprenyl-diphosphatase